MIQVNMRGFSKVLSAVVVLAMMTGSAHAGQDPEPNYPPDGTWLAFATQGCAVPWSARWHRAG